MRIGVDKVYQPQIVTFVADFVISFVEGCLLIMIFPLNLTANTVGAEDVGLRLVVVGIFVVAVPHCISAVDVGLIYLLACKFGILINGQGLIPNDYALITVCHIGKFARCKIFRNNST